MSTDVLPGQRILGLTKLARVVELFARPQVQERVTQQVADWLDDHVAPPGSASSSRQNISA